MIHRFRQNGINIVLDVNSGSVHIMDDLAYVIAGMLERDAGIGAKEIIDSFDEKFGRERYSESEASEALRELNVLIDDGRLFSKDVFQRGVPQKKSVVKALCLHIAHDCNLRCKYCFAGEGGYNGKRGLMSAETGKRAVEFLALSSGERHNLEVDFFGGEPTLNFDVVKEIVRHGQLLEKIYNKRYRFTLTTNAYAITDEIIDFANENMSNIVLSIDGRPETNDFMRPASNGASSYEKILPNILKFVEKRKGKDYYVRGTYTKYNCDFTQDVLHLYNLGLKHISVEPVVAPPDKDYAINESDVPGLFDEYEKLAVIVLENEDLEFFHFNIDLSGGSCAVKRISGCGAGCEYMSVTPDGSLYPCHQFVGNEEFKLGDIYKGIENDFLSSKFRGLNVYTKSDCCDCWAKFYCSGGCAANAYYFGGDISSSYEIGCMLQKKRIECALYMNAARVVRADS